ncbi:MAG: RNA polymerase sigma factor [Phycisphaerales bacterium]
MSITRTTTVLLKGLEDPGCHWAWAEFDERYRPLLHAVARRAGLNEADAADVAQDTIAVFVRKYADGGYDRDRARVRTWLCGIARLQIADLLRKRARRHEFAAGSDPAAGVPDEQTMTQAWEQARRSWLLRLALEQLRSKSRFSPATIEAFELNAIRGMGAEQIAERLQMSVHDVYMAKHRVTERLRTVLEQIEREHGDEEL